MNTETTGHNKIIRQVSVLLIEDSELIRLRVKNMLDEDPTATYLMEAKETLAAGLGYLDEATAEVILLDLGLPDSQGLDTFKAVKAQAGNTPIVIFTATGDDEIGAEAMRLGAQDYLAKEHVRHPTVLSRALRYAIERYKIEIEREEVIAELSEALTRIKTLSGLLPICASCKKIRDEEGYWQQVEQYVASHTEVQFSHGICEDCIEKLYPEIAERMKHDEARKNNRGIKFHWKK